MALDWDLINEDCADISDWTDQDSNAGASTQETFDGKSCFKLYAPQHAGVTYNDAVRMLQPGTIGTSWTIEISFYGHTYSSPTGLILIFSVRNSVASPNTLQSRLPLSANKIDLRAQTSTPGYVRADALVEEDTWNVLRWINDAGVQSVWLNGKLYLHNISNSYVVTSFSVNTVHLYLLSSETGDRITYVDYVKMDSSVEYPAGSALPLGMEDIVLRYRQTNAGVSGEYSYVNGAEKVRTYGPTRYGAYPQVLSVPLVGTGDGNASKVRIYDGNDIKALMKLPA